MCRYKQYKMSKAYGLWIITWRKVAFLFINLLLFSNNTYHVSAEGNIGCRFADTLCMEGIEFCYDDYAFGKCLPQYGTDREDTLRDPLTEKESSILATMLEELQGAGLGWEHPFVQCRMQGALFALRHKTTMPNNLCASLTPDPEILGPQSPMAFVRFTPPNEDFADEVYYPPLKREFDDRTFIQPIMHRAQPPLRTPIAAIEELLPDLTNLDVNEYKSTFPNQNPAEFLYGNNQDLENRIKDIKNRIELRRMLAEYESGNLKPPIYYKSGVIDQFNDEGTERNLMNEQHLKAQQQLLHQQQMLPIEQHEHQQQQQHPPHLNTNNKQNNEEYWRQQNKRTGSYFKEREDMLEKKELSNLLNQMNIMEEPNDGILPKTYFREVAIKEHIPTVNEDELISSLDNRDDRSESTNYFNNLPYEDDRNLRFIKNEIADMNELPQDGVRENPLMYQHRRQMVAPEAGVYTEGGLVYIPGTDGKKAAADTRDEARNILEDMLGFTRHERLDVKKPGPPAAPPPAAASPHELPSVVLKQTKTPEQLADISKEVVPSNVKISSKIKKLLLDHTDDDHGPHSVDTEYAHVIFKNPIDNWKDGARIVTALAEILNLQFTHTRVDRHEVSFRVEPNPEKKTAADVAKAINDSRFKNNLSRRLGVIVIRAGVGDKTKDGINGSVSAEKVESAEDAPDVTHVMAYMFAGAGAAAIVVIVITLFLIRKHDRKRDKLGGLQAGLSGAESCSKDYQELCRARMAGKGSTTESPVGRIASLNKDSDKPPSSRSSTSSWSEEPTLTNMDISTGHMVLSYMEDHLRNKGRLQREWEALCRYEAEPSAREAAIQTQCASMNRPGAPLPFDHSRVVLNHLANAEALDYINASTITDHDPRAPAYVAAQGPLTSTLAHFWQMIWEQGAVVIVALCRLQENGDTVCARYWPEEGAEVYHIYEVHLVSEHIWCDDYLVRSFYLKNLRTGETRTVTQFHFLSWPQTGVPSSAKALLEFRRKVNKSYRGRSCPIVVHSSNGAGRTGAYILLDLVLARMNKGAREIDIAATLEHLRDQRAGLVATRQQFEFVLMAVAEEVHAILKALPTNAQTTDKREIDKESIKEQDSEQDKPVDKTTTEENTN